jgi:amino acid transporter
MPVLDGIGTRFWISSIIWIGLFGAFDYAMEVVLKDKDNTAIRRAFALGVGIGCTAVIAGMDYLFRVNELLNTDEMKFLLLKGIATCVFGAVVIGILFFRVGARKVREDWMEKSWKPMMILGILAAGYIGIWLLGKPDPRIRYMYPSNSAFDYLFSQISVLVYTMVYPLVWWFLQCATQEKAIDKNIGAGL